MFGTNDKRNDETGVEEETMGKLVTFWSPYSGKSKVTSSMCAIATQFGMDYPELSIAISHTGPGEFSLEDKIDARIGTMEEKQELYRKTGIGALKISYRQAMLTSEKIRHSAINLRMKSLFLYPNMEKEKDELSFLILSKILKDEFDVVFLDVESGKKEDTFRYFAASDLIVVVLPQDPGAWKLINGEEVLWGKGEAQCIIIGGYLNTVKYGKSYLYRNMDGKQKKALCGVIPVNCGFFDAMAEGRTIDFFYRNQRVRRKEENYDFITQTRKTAENIRTKLFVS